MKNAHFYIKDAKVDGKKLVVSGDYVLDHTPEVESSGGSSSGQSGGITVPPRLKVKWILPPLIERNPLSVEMYGHVKKAAQDAGYETVEHGDLSYPPSR